MTRDGRAQDVGRSLIGSKASRVSQRSVASVLRRSGRGCDSGARVYADRLLNGVRGSRAAVVRSQVTLIAWPIIHFLFTRMSVAHDIDLNASLRSDDKSLTTDHESKKFKIFSTRKSFLRWSRIGINLSLTAASDSPAKHATLTSLTLKNTNNLFLRDMTHAANNKTSIYTLRPQQNGNIRQAISSGALFDWNFYIWMQFHWGLFLAVQSTIRQHWVSYWLGRK